MPGVPSRILGVDPGSRATGYGVIEVRGSRARLVAEDALRPESRAELPQRLVWIRDRLREVVRRHRPAHMAVESLFVGKNPRSASRLAQVRGVVLLVGAEAGCAIHEYTPAQVKMAATGYGRADKEQVRRMVGVLLSLPRPPRSTDAADALAAALCHAARQGGAHEALARMRAAGAPER